MLKKVATDTKWGGSMKLGGKDGLTMPEALIACLILGLTLSGMLTGFVMCQKTIAYANNGLTAMHRARGIMETLVNSKYDSSSLSSGTHSLANGYYVVTENAGVKDLALTVTWMDQLRSAASSVTLTTSLANSTHR